MDWQRVFDYSNRVRATLRLALEENPGVADREFDSISDYKTIRSLIAHIAGAEERWIVGAIGGQLIPIRYEDRAPQTLAQTFDDWDGFRAETKQVLATDLNQTVEYNLAKWGMNVRMTREEVIYHLFNHESGHRGAITLVLQQFGIDPPNLDYPFHMTPLP